MIRILCIALVFCFSWMAAFAQAPTGIPRELARQRAQQLKDVRYELAYNLRPKADSIAGHEDLRFEQNADDRGILPEWLDFREGSVSLLTINGHGAPPAIQNGHIELPAKYLKLGENLVEIDFIAPVAPAGKAVTRFEDKDDGSEYLYTLFVPMDADMAFPCFDQPDLKGKFKLTITAPLDWNVISNSVGQEVMKQGDGAFAIHRIAFAETKPISTYLFAFAAGPFQKVHDTPGLPGLYVRKSKVQKAEAEAADVQQVTADGIKYLSDYFVQPFPFPKYDLVLIPNFAYGGMEHAGATFLREESILFRAVPTHSAYIRRDILLLHELTHQWFGDLVTMRWFDDLWLKEGFAQYMAYHALNSLLPDENMWKRFSESIKPSAYLIDSTLGTTPIYQDIPNLNDAKSAYGAIVYSKAPGVIKQLAFVVGEDQFRDGLRLYLKEHAYGNAEWNDLVHALERTSKKQLGPWADAWIKKRAMPQVDVAWSCDAKKETAEIQLSQHDVLKEGRLWPIATQILIHGNSGDTFKRFDFATAKSDVIQVHGCPEYIFANDHDYAYGRFLLDSASQKAVMAQLGNVHDLFQRTLLWGSLITTVREAEMSPRDFIELALHLLPSEQDETLAASNISRTSGALLWFVSDEVRKEIAPRFEDLAYDQMLHST
ncbi:MAG TPA: M1 family aminopeptidase, partial [Candidatus Angelobacter sp.]|nr:M1 family aminopeptidase [Candidatus Angelobacter sp.]